MESEAAAYMDDESKYELREQKIRLDKEFGEMLGKISGRKEMLSTLEQKLNAVDKARQLKEEELRTLERKLVVLLEEQQNEIDAIRRKQDLRSLTSDNGSPAAGAAGAAPSSSTALVLVPNAREGGSGGSGPSLQEKRQVWSLKIPQLFESGKLTLSVILLYCVGCTINAEH